MQSISILQKKKKKKLIIYSTWATQEPSQTWLIWAWVVFQPNQPVQVTALDFTDL